MSLGRHLRYLFTNLQQIINSGAKLMRLTGVRKWRRWAVFGSAAAVALGVGSTTYYYTASEANRRSAEANRAAAISLDERLADITRQRDAARSELAGYRARETDLNTRESATVQREGAAKKREDAVKEREEAATQHEKVQAENSIQEGTWSVGVDVQPGTYRTRGTVSGQCYWAIYSDANGRNIVANDIVTGGRPTVTLAKGQFFETHDCGDWAKS